MSENTSLRELVAKWRAKAEEATSITTNPLLDPADIAWNAALAQQATFCADELEAALSTPPAEGMDAKRLNWLEKVGFTTCNPDRSLRVPNVNSWNKDGEWRWTAHYVGSEFKSAREAIDAAMIAATEGE